MGVPYKVTGADPTFSAPEGEECLRTDTNEIFKSRGGGTWVKEVQDDNAADLVPSFTGIGNGNGLVADPGGAPAGQFLKDDGTFDTPGGGGDVVGPAGAVADNIVAFNGATGKLIKDSGLTLSGTNTGDEVAATTTVAGIVELATDGESAANVVVQGNDNRLSNSRTPTSHAASHSDGGADEITVENLATSGGLGTVVTSDGAGGLTMAAPGTPGAHAATHENGGLDEISVAGLSGLLADAQNPTNHASNHTDGTDDIQDATASQKGLATAAQITKLDGIDAGANLYTHPNHTGDVTSVGDGAQTIANNAVTNAKLADMSASGADAAQRRGWRHCVTDR
jgi:hypothetical protein